MKFPKKPRTKQQSLLCIYIYITANLRILPLLGWDFIYLANYMWRKSHRSYKDVQFIFRFNHIKYMRTERQTTPLNAPLPEAVKTHK